MMNGFPHPDVVNKGSILKRGVRARHDGKCLVARSLAMGYGQVQPDNPSEKKRRKEAREWTGWI